MQERMESPERQGEGHRRDRMQSGSGRLPPGAHQPRHVTPQSPEMFQVELQGTGMSRSRGPAPKNVFVPETGLSAAQVSNTGHLPSSMGGYSSTVRTTPASAVPRMGTGKSSGGFGSPLGSSISPEHESPRVLTSSVMGFSPLASAGGMSQGVMPSPLDYGFGSHFNPRGSIMTPMTPMSTISSSRTHRSLLHSRSRGRMTTQGGSVYFEDEEVMQGSALEIRPQAPPAEQPSFSALDKLLISTSERNTDFVQAMAKFDPATLISSVEAFQLPPMKEKPSLTPALLDGLRQQDVPHLTLDTLGNNNKLILQPNHTIKGNFRQRDVSGKSLPSADAGNPSLLEAGNGALVEQLTEGLPRGVETGEDAVVHIISSGGAEGLVLYCNYAKRTAGEQFNPYELRVVRMHDAEPEHYAISNGGVTHIVPGQETEVMPLHEWIRQKRLYSLVTRLPFFGKHTLSKAFWKWTVGIRLKRYHTLQQKLSTSMLNAHKLYGPSLRKVAATIASIRLDGNHLWRKDPMTEGWTLAERAPQHDLDENLVETAVPLAHRLGSIGSMEKSFALEEYQASRREISEEIELVLHEVMDVVAFEHTRTGKAIIEELDQAYPKQPTAQELRAARYVKPKNKWKADSMSQQKEDRKEKEARQAASVHDADLMGRFMRLCDVMLVAGLIDLCHHSLKEVKAQLQAPRKHGVITVFGDLESTSSFGNPADPPRITSCTVVFAPAKDDLENVMRSTIAEIVDVVSKTPRPLYFPEFLEYFDPFESAKPPQTAGLGDLLRKEIPVDRVEEYAVDLIGHDYDVMLTNPGTAFYMNSSVPYAFAASWDRAAYDSRNPTAADISNDLNTMRTWYLDLTATRNMIMSGLLQLDCTRLRAILQVPAVDTIKGMSVMLHQTFVDHATAVTAKLKATVSDLKKRPTDFRQFSAFISEIGKHLNASGEGRKESAGNVMTARTLLYLLQPGLEDEEKELLEAERLDALGHSETETGDSRSRNTSEIGGAISHHGSPHGAASMGQWAASGGASVNQPGGTSPVMKRRNSFVSRKAAGHPTQAPTLLSQERELIKGMELVSRSLVSLSRKPRTKSTHNMATILEGPEDSFKQLLSPDVEVLVQHGITAHEAKERIETQIALFDEVCRLYKEYEAWCRDTGTYVASYKPIMSNAITQAAMQTERDVENLVRRSRGKMLCDPETDSGEAILEISSIDEGLEKCLNEAQMFQHHQDVFNVDQSESLKNKVDSAREMLSIRKKLWEEYALWLFTKKQMMDDNVLRGITIVATELQESLDKFAVAIERMEELHVDDNELNTKTATPGEAAFVGVLHNLLTSWRSNQLMVDKLLDPAMRAHHINLLLLELKLINAIPKATASSVHSKSMAGSSRGRSFRERLASRKNLSIAMADTGVADKSESGPVVSFLDLLNKATATKRSQETVKDMWTMAVAEQQLHSSMEVLQNSWDGLFFLFSSTRLFGLYPFANLSALKDVLSKSKTELDIMAESPYLPGVLWKYEEVESLLGTLVERVGMVETCQTLWIFLTRLLQRPEAASGFPPDKAADFEKISNSWKMLGLFLQEGRSSLVSASTGLDAALGSIGKLKDSMLEIQSEAAVLVEDLREGYPRFYFAEDHELLHALAYNSSPHLLPPSLLGSIFPGVYALKTEVSLDIDENEVRTIVGAIGRGDEELPFSQSITVLQQSKLCDVMRQVEVQLFASLQELTHNCLAACAEMKGPDWVASFPLQCITLVDSIVWTDSVTNCLSISMSEDERGGLRQLLEQSSLRLETMARQINSVATAATSRASSPTTGENNNAKPLAPEGSTVLDPLSTTVVRGFKALLSAGVLRRDVIEGMIAKKVVEPTDFEWQRQVRYYWDRDFGTCLVNVADTSLRYGFEYQGAEVESLGALTTAIIPGLLGSAAGLDECPILTLDMAKFAGISSRDAAQSMAAMFGRAFFPVACTPQMDYRATASLLRALIRCQAWGAFQNCDSMDPQAMSQLAQQIYSMRQGLLQDREQITIGGLDVEITKDFQENSPAVVLFLDSCSARAWEPSSTVRDNPLPEAVRWLSRRVQLHSISVELPFEAGLRSLGLGSAKEASRSMAVLIKMARQQFSSTPQSVFGLSMVRVILQALEDSQAFGDAFDHMAKASEGVLCSLVEPEHEDSMRTLVKIILAPTRASSAARPRSEGLPPPLRQPQNAPSPPPRLMPPASASPIAGVMDGDLRLAIRNVANSMHTRSSQSTFQPMLNKEAVAEAGMQLHRAMKGPHVTVVVGPAGVGKTMTRHCLIEAMSSLDVHVEEQLLFPATLTLSELLGKGQGSNETYGLLGRIMRRGFRKQTVNGELSEWPGTSLEALDPDSPIALRGRVQHNSKDGTTSTSPTMENSYADGDPAFQAETDEDGNPKHHLAAEKTNLSAFVRTEALGVEDSKVLKESTPLLVLDGPLAGEMPGILLPLLTGGQLCHSGEGGSLHSVEGLQVVWETDSLAGLSPADAVCVAMVHIGGRLLEQPKAAATRILNGMPKMFGDGDLSYDATTFKTQALLLTSVIAIWQRFPDVAVESAGEMQARVTQGICDVCDVYLQVLRDSILTMENSTHDQFMQLAFPWSMLWGLGSRLTTDKQRQRLETTIRQNWRGTFPDVELPPGSLWDYRLAHRSCSWVPWNSDVSKMLASKPVQDGDNPVSVDLRGLALHPQHVDHGEMCILVPTVDTVSREHVLTVMLAGGRSPLLIGPSGCGKSLVLRHLLTVCPILRPDKVHSMKAHLHATSSPWGLQDELKETLVQIDDTMLRPAIGHVGLVVVEDLHVPVQVSHVESGESSCNPRVLEWIRQVADRNRFTDMKTGAGVSVSGIQMLGSSNTMNLVDGSPCASHRFLRHWQQVGICDGSWKLASAAFLDPHSKNPVFPPFKNAADILGGIAHRLMLSTHEAVAAFYVDPVADQLTQATLSAAKELLMLEIHAPVPLPGGNLTLPGSLAAADDEKVQVGFAAQGLVRPLTLRRMERIMQRVRSMLCRLADSADDGAALSSLRKQVGYVWLHEASRELADELPCSAAKDCRLKLLQVASDTFASFKDTIVQFPSRLKGTDRMEWAGLLTEGCEVEGCQIGPADIATAHKEMLEDHDDTFNDIPLKKDHDWSDGDSDDDTVSVAASTKAHSVTSSKAYGYASPSARLLSRYRSSQSDGIQEAWTTVTRLRLQQPQWSSSVIRMQASLAQPFELGNMVLVGPPCSGRISAARLAAMRAGAEAAILRIESQSKVPPAKRRTNPEIVLDQIKEAVRKAVEGSSKAIAMVVVPQELTDDDTIMGLLQEIITGWRYADKLAADALDQARLEKQQIEAEAAAKSKPPPLKVLPKTKSSIAFNLKELVVDTDTENDESETPGSTSKDSPGFPYNAKAARSTSGLSRSGSQRAQAPAMPSLSTAATAVLSTIKKETEKAKENTLQKKLKMTVDAAIIQKRIQQTYQGSGAESSLVSVDAIGNDGSAMFGAGNSRAVRLMRTHIEALELSTAAASSSRSAVENMAYSSNQLKAAFNRRWEIKGNLSARKLREKVRCMLVLSPERQKDVALKFPALNHALQVVRFGEVEAEAIAVTTADLLRRSAVVALLPPQLKAVHEFTANPRQTFDKQPHELAGEKQVFAMARQRTFGPEGRQYPAPHEEEGKDGAAAEAKESISLAASSKLQHDLGIAPQAAPQLKVIEHDNLSPKASPKETLTEEQAAQKAELILEIQAEGLPPGSMSGKRMGKAIVALHRIAQQAYQAYSRNMGATVVAPLSKIQEVVNLLDPILSQHRKQLSNMQASVGITLTKMKQMEVAAETCSNVVDVTAPQLEQAAIDTAETLLRFNEKEIQTDEKRAVVLAHEKRIKQMADLQEQARQEAHEDLVKTQFEYEEAMEKIINLADQDIDELRSYISPPGLVQKVMEAVCILFRKPIDWKSAKQLLLSADLDDRKYGGLGPRNNPFKTRVINYDVDNVDDSMFNRLQYFKNNPSFTPQAVAQVSKAAKSLCIWVLAVERYASMRRNNQEIQSAMDLANFQMQELEEKCAVAKEYLHNAEMRLRSIELSYKESLDHENNLKKTLEDQRKRASRCEQLRRALVNCRARWEDCVQMLKDEIDKLQGNALMAACAVVYLGPFPEEIRKEIIGLWYAELTNNWHLKCSPGFSLAAFMALRDRTGRYIPRKIILDKLRKDNLFMLSLTKQIPLILDPDGEGVASLKALNHGSMWVGIKLHESNSVFKVMEAVSSGSRVFLQINEKNIDLRNLAALSSAYKEFITSSKTNQADGQRLFMYIRSRRLDFPALVYEMFNVIQFAVGTEGLEQRILAVVMHRLYPRIEQQKRQLIITKGTQAPMSEDLDMKILRFISKAADAIWDDSVLVDTIVSNATLLDSTLVEMEEQDVELGAIAEIEDRWRGVAQLAGELFATLSEMSTWQPACMTSWATFLSVLRRALREPGIQRASDVEVQDKDLDGPEDNAKSVETIVIPALFQSIMRRLPRTIGRAVGLTFSLSVLERNGHVLPEERTFFSTLSCAPAALEDLRHAGIATGSDHPLRPGRANGDSASLTASSESTMLRAASVKQSSDSTSGRGAQPPSVPTLPIFMASDSMISRQEQPQRSQLATLSAGENGGPLPFIVESQPLLQPQQSNESLGSQTLRSESSENNKHVPLFGSKNVLPGRLDAHDPSWPSPALLADLRVLEDVYPDPDKPFQGIAKALQDDPEAWQKACMSPCPPETLPPPFGPSMLHAEQQDPSPLAPAVGLRAPSPTSSHRAELSPLPSYRSSGPLPSYRSSGRGSNVQSISGTGTATPVQELSAMSLTEQQDPGSLTDFQKLLLCSIICPERFATCCDWLLERMMGPAASESHSMRLQGVLSDSPSNVPILLHSSSGEDPALTIEQVAACVADGAENPFASFSTLHKLGAMATKDTIRSEVLVVSMGQNQTLEADEILTIAMSLGHWVVVLNCHMDINWCRRATSRLAEIHEARMTAGFRLWLCTRSERLPQLQRSFLSKVLLVPLEPSHDINSYLVRLWSSIAQDPVSGPLVSQEPNADLWRGHIFGLSVAMAVLSLENGNKSPLAWSQADFHKGVELLRRIVYHMGSTRFLDYMSLQRLLQHILFDQVLPGEIQQKRSTAALSLLLTHDILSVHYPIHKKVAKNDTADFSMLPCTGLADACRFFKEILPPASAVHLIMGTHPRLELLDEAPQALNLIKELQHCWRRSNADSKRVFMSLKDLAGGPVFMNPDRLVIWANELLNALGMVAGLITGFQEGISRTSRTKTAGLATDHAVLQVLLVESQHIHHVIKLASSELQGIVSAMSSAVEPSGRVLMVARMLSVGLVPSDWVPDGVTSRYGNRLQATEPTLLGWRTVLQARLEFLRSFKESPPAVWDLSVVAYPRAVLAALLRAFASENEVSPTMVGFRTVVLQPSAGNPTEPPSTGIYVGGLHLKGASWNSEEACLSPLSEDRLFSKMPVVWLIPSHLGALQQTKSTRKGGAFYECPVLPSPDSMAEPNSEIVTIRLQTSSRQPPEQWLIAGVAAVVSTTG